MSSQSQCTTNQRPSHLARHVDLLRPQRLPYVTSRAEERLLRKSDSLFRGTCPVHNLIFSIFRLICKLRAHLGNISRVECNTSNLRSLYFCFTLHCLGIYMSSLLCVSNDNDSQPRNGISKDISTYSAVYIPFSTA